MRCEHCDHDIRTSYYEHINSGKKYCLICFDLLGRANLAFKLLCKLRF